MNNKLQLHKTLTTESKVPETSIFDEYTYLNKKNKSTHTYLTSLSNLISLFYFSKNAL